MPPQDLHSAPFLEPEQAPPEGNQPSLDFRSPDRPLQNLTPLVDAAEAYPAMERLALSARKTLHMAFRIFDPSTRIRSRQARDQGFERWSDLLLAKAREGVKVRLWVNDFDSVIANDWHRDAWRTAGAFAEAVGADDEAGRNIDVILTVHEGEFGLLPRWVFWLPVRARIVKLLGGGDGKRVMEESPGLAETILVDDAPRPVFLPPVRMWPVTHHHKMMVVDGARVILGGLDVNERRFDDPDHEKPAQRTWHDLSVSFEGALAYDCERHFRTMWPREARRFVEVLERLEKRGWRDFARRFPRPRLFDFDQPLGDPPKDESGGAGERGQILRTVSLRRRKIAAMTPAPVRTDILAGYLRLIGMAQQTLYIENQFLRHRRTIEAIAARLREQDSLQVIMLAPAAPEEVAYMDHDGSDARHAEWLQATLLRELVDEHGDRVGIFTLARDEPLHKVPGEEASPRGVLHGSGAIYIHSKAMIADDRAAIVGSANINGRSLLMDTEIAILWEGTSVRTLREKLWQAHFLGEAPDAASGALESWRAIATNNARTMPHLRRGFVVPYELAAAERFGRRVWYIPDRFI